MELASIIVTTLLGIKQADSNVGPRLGVADFIVNTQLLGKLQS